MNRDPVRLFGRVLAMIITGLILLMAILAVLVIAGWVR